MTHSAPIVPTKFAHIVYRTYQYDRMLAWYQQVFGARVQFQNPLLAFLSYDDEHHRVALVNLSLVAPEGADAPRGPGTVDHVSYTFESLHLLCAKYEQLKAQGVLPVWCVHHGFTISMYYADPDGNRMEFQIDCFGSVEEANAFLAGPKFQVNPVGVAFDPDDMVAQLRAGTPAQAFFHRQNDLPVSMPPR
jgi:catechol-2,3-dioxygenase